MTEVWLVRTTFAKKEEALSVARMLLEERLVACVNIDESTTALFRWEGTLQQENEVVMLAKTVKANAHSVIARVKSLHSYQVPSILAWPSQATETHFADWVHAEVVQG